MFRQAGRMYDSVHYLNAQSRATEYSLGLQQRALFLRVSSRFHARPPEHYFVRSHDLILYLYV